MSCNFIKRAIYSTNPNAYLVRYSQVSNPSNETCSRSPLPISISLVSVRNKVFSIILEKSSKHPHTSSSINEQKNYQSSSAYVLICDDSIIVEFIS